MANKLSAELRLDLKRFRLALKKATSSIRKFALTAGKNIARKIGAGIRGAASFIANALKFALIGGAIAAAVLAAKTIIDSVRGAIESERILMRFEVLSGDAGTAADLFAEVRKDALRTGVEIESMVGGISRFMAGGFSADEALKLNRGMIDVAGSVGMTSEEVMRLGSALSQVMAKGVASMEELRQQIAEKGVPIFDALADKLTGGDKGLLIKKVSLGEVDAKEVLDLFSNLDGSFAKFKGGAEKMAGTFGGQIAVMGRGWDEFLRVMGEPIRDALRPILTGAIGLITKLRENAAKIGEAVAAGVDKAIATFQVLRSMTFADIAGTFGAAMKVAITDIGNFLIGNLVGILTVAPQTFFAMMTNASRWKGIGEMLTSVLKTAVAAAIEKLPKFLYAGRTDGRAGAAAESRDEAAAAWKNADRLFGKANEQDFGGIGAQISGIARDFSNVIDATEAKAQLDAFTKAIKDNAAKITEARLKLAKPVAEAKKAMKAAAGVQGPTGGKIGTTGSIGQMMNVLSGRSANEVLASEARKTNAHFARANKTLESMDKKLGKQPAPLTMNTRIPMPSAVFA